MIISIHNQKGGAGKTTLAAVIAAEIADMGYKVLLLDQEGQTSITKKRMIELKDKNLYDIRSVWENIPENLKVLEKQYDIILIDLPGNFVEKFIYTFIALSNAIIIPTSLTETELLSIVTYIDTLNDYISTLGLDINKIGVLTKLHRGSNVKLRSFISEHGSKIDDVVFDDETILYRHSMFEELLTNEKYIDQERPAYVNNLVVNILNKIK